MEAHKETRTKSFLKLCDVQARLAKLLRTPTLGDDLLQTLQIHRAGDLDVDDPSGPQFFDPWGSDRLPFLREQSTEERWTTRCTIDANTPLEDLPDPWGDDVGQPWCDPFTEAHHRLLWFSKIFTYKLQKQSQWRNVTIQPRDRRYLSEGYYYPQCTPDGVSLGEYPTFHAGFTCDIKDESLPHTMCAVQDMTVAGTDLLRSEVIHAVALIKRHVRSSCFLGHHTFPVLILSFQHDRVARITQFHFDGDKIYFRPSRQLNLYDDEPTDDAFLVLRWLACRPVGDTADTKPTINSGPIAAVAEPDFCHEPAAVVALEA